MSRTEPNPSDASDESAARTRPTAFVVALVDWLSSPWARRRPIVEPAPGSASSSTPFGVSLVDSLSSPWVSRRAVAPTPSEPALPASELEASDRAPQVPGPCPS